LQKENFSIGQNGTVATVELISDVWDQSNLASDVDLKDVLGDIEIFTSRQNKRRSSCLIIKW
jgi:hypothetical protein